MASTVLALPQPGGMVDQSSASAIVPAATMPMVAEATMLMPSAPIVQGNGTGGELVSNLPPHVVASVNDKKVVPGGTFAVGEAVDPPSFPVKQDLKHERITGVVSRHNPSNGWGYVKSHMFEGDIYFQTDRIMPEFQGHPLSEGEAVEFDVQADDHGRPHAVAMKPIIGRKAYECLGQRHRGYVRRFAERWGFLNAAAFDGDLFVHRDNLLPLADGQPPLRAGHAVEFDVALDDRGRAVAKQITTCALLRPCDWIGHRLRGYIRSFQGAWGFINSDRFAGDLFVHRDSLLAQHQIAQLVVSTVVEFDVERDHHQKGAKNRLVARKVAVLGPGDGVAQQPATYTGIPPTQPPMPNPPHLAQQAALPMDPAVFSTLPPQQPLSPGYGTLNPQAASFAPSQAATMYYPQASHTAAGTMPEQLGALGYNAPQYPCAQPQYPIQQQMLPSQQQYPPQYAQQPYTTQPQYGQPPYTSQPRYGMPRPQALPPGQPLSAMPQPPPMATSPPTMVQAQPQAYIPAGAPPATTLDEQQRAAMAAMQQQQPAGQSMVAPTQDGEIPKVDTAAMGVPPAGSGMPVPVQADGQSQGLLHITMHDWEPDQQGQLYVTKGTLVSVSYRAAHGWVYAGTVQPGNEAGEPASEGWIPQAVVKRVSICRVAIDWPGEGTGTLGVASGEIIAVSKEADKGWVYGERIGPRPQDRPSDGWLPKKVLDYLQS